MIIKIAKVSDKGQIAIPKVIREKAGISRGDELVIVQSNGRILLEKSKKLSAKMEDDFRDLLKFSEDALRDIWDDEEDEVWSSYLKK